MASTKSEKNSNGANVGYEAELWQMAVALRGSMDAAEYKHVVLGLIFLKYISGRRLSHSFTACSCCGHRSPSSQTPVKQTTGRHSAVTLPR